MVDEKIELYAINIGQRKAPTSTFLYFTEPQKEITITYYFWCLRYKGKVILIDTGFKPEMAQDSGLGIFNIRHPLDQLSKLSIKPDEIDLVICTHLHWDHVGGVDFFPKATFYVPERDLAFFTGPAIKYNKIRQTVRQQDLNDIVNMAYEGRVIFLNGDQTILPGVKVYWVGGHTPGSHFVSVDAGEVRAVLASDLGGVYRNITEGIIPGIYVDFMETVRGLQRLKEVAIDESLIIPGHDPEVCSRFITEDGEIIRII